jgi:hypothetical protein
MMCAVGCLQKFRRAIGYASISPNAQTFVDKWNSGDKDVRWPKVQWIKVSVLSSTVKAEAPKIIYDAFGEWEDWSTTIQQVRKWTSAGRFVSASGSVRSLPPATYVPYG